jgi:hypothetical protein
MTLNDLETMILNAKEQAQSTGEVNVMATVVKIVQIHEDKPFDLFNIDDFEYTSADTARPHFTMNISTVK